MQNIHEHVLKMVELIYSNSDKPKGRFYNFLNCQAYSAQGLFWIRAFGLGITVKRDHFKGSFRIFKWSVGAIKN